MPTTRPERSTSGPPELPGLIAASVWIASITVLTLSVPESSPVRTGRSRALTMPDVTLPCSPSGEPMATTSWPGCRVAELPSVALVRPWTPAILMTARSVTGSRPTMLAVWVEPSLRVAVIEPAPSAASATTWLLVRTSPSEDSTMPLPSPPPCWVLTSMETTLGSTAAATCSTEPFGALLAGPETPVPASDVPAVGSAAPFPSSPAVSAAPAPPPTRPAARATAPSRATPRRGRGASDRWVAGGGVPGGSPWWSGARQGS